jgi:hypothetical protein
MPSIFKIVRFDPSLYNSVVLPFQTSSLRAVIDISYVLKDERTANSL